MTIIVNRDRIYCCILCILNFIKSCRDLLVSVLKQDIVNSVVQSRIRLPCIYNNNIRKHLSLIVRYKHITIIINLEAINLTWQLCLYASNYTYIQKTDGLHIMGYLSCTGACPMMDLMLRSNAIIFISTIAHYVILISLSEGQQQHTNAATCSMNGCKGVTCSWLVNNLVYSTTHKLHQCLYNSSAYINKHRW